MLERFIVGVVGAVLAFLLPTVALGVLGASSGVLGWGLALGGLASAVALFSALRANTRRRAAAAVVLWLGELCFLIGAAAPVAALRWVAEKGPNGFWQPLLMTLFVTGGIAFIAFLIAAILLYGGRWLAQDRNAVPRWLRPFVRV